MKLKFINHASYLVENEKTILLHDPWLEGRAFNNGWELLSQEIGNLEMIEYLVQSKKSIFIWVSHEHSDHFSIPFLKELKASGLRCKFLFQTTTDKRAIKYLKHLKFDVIECIDGKEYELDKNFHLSVYSYYSGDAFCFLRTKEKNILNINDCVINSELEAKNLLNRLPDSCKIDILFTQFGYANWIGRKEDLEQKKKQAQEKFKRIVIQDSVFNPKAIIPFASFINFCKDDNFHLNETQNTPNSLRQSIILTNIQKKITFMKPLQVITCDNNFLSNLQLNTSQAEDYWNRLFSNKKNITLVKDSDSVSINEIIIKGKEYIRKVRLETFSSVMFFELFKLLGLQPITFHIYDLNLYLTISYLKGIKIITNSNESSMSIHSSEIFFILKNDFGWNTLQVSGAFRATNSSIKEVSEFFRWQDAIKNGFSYKQPSHTLRVSLSFIRRSFTRPEWLDS